MNIEVLLTEEEIANEFAESMEARDLPEKFFYWSPLSVRAWKDLAGISHAALQQTWTGFASKAMDLTNSFGSRVPVISFGAGEGAKDRTFLRALRAASREVKYFPVDASQTLLEMACAGAEDDECEALGIKADISSPMHLLLAADVSESPRLFFMVGNTFGAFDPIEQIKHIADCLKSGDLLILDAQIHRNVDLTFGEYPPTPEQKRFAFAPLAGLGIAVEDGELKFEEKRDERQEGLFLMTRRFQVSRDLKVIAAGREVQIARGERILLNFRYQFTSEAFRSLLMNRGGLKVIAEIPSADGRFVTAVCIK